MRRVYSRRRVHAEEIGSREIFSNQFTEAGCRAAVAAKFEGVAGVLRPRTPALLQNRARIQRPSATRPLGISPARRIRRYVVGTPPYDSVASKVVRWLVIRDRMSRRLHMNTGCVASSRAMARESVGSAGACSRREYWLCQRVRTSMLLLHHACAEYANGVCHLRFIETAMFTKS